MKASEKKKISIVKKKPIDMDKAREYITKGANAVLTQEPDPVVEIGLTLPWEDPDIDLEKLTPVAQLYIPKEYALKLDFIKKTVGISKQRVLRDATIESINKILKSHFKD